MTIILEKLLHIAPKLPFYEHEHEERKLLLLIGKLQSSLAAARMDLQKRREWN